MAPLRKNAVSAGPHVVPSHFVSRRVKRAVFHNSAVNRREKGKEREVKEGGRGGAV